MLIAPEEPTVETISAPVLKVFDGDGFLTRLWNRDTKSEHDVIVRLGFTDAPELEQLGGHEAKAFLTSLIADRWLELVVLIKMDTGRVFDRHGRMVCVPYLREDHAGGTARNIELEMVLNGWSWVLDRYEPDERYFEALEDAKRHRRGIWAFDHNIHPWEFKKRKYRERSGATGRAQKGPHPGSDIGEKCPESGCGGHLIARNGRFGTFLGCSHFPRCRYSRSA